MWTNKQQYVFCELTWSPGRCLFVWFASANGDHMLSEGRVDWGVKPMTIKDDDGKDDDGKEDEDKEDEKLVRIR